MSRGDASAIYHRICSLVCGKDVNAITLSIAKYPSFSRGWIELVKARVKRGLTFSYILVATRMTSPSGLSLVYVVDIL